MFTKVLFDVTPVLAIICLTTHFKKFRPPQILFL